jgi:hypothetical protein
MMRKMGSPKGIVFIGFVMAFMWLAPVSRAQVEEVFLTPHFHYDPVFEQDQNDYTDVGFDRCRRFLADLAADPDYAAVFSEIDYLKPFFDAYPEERENILALIAANRIETGGSYSEPNEMSVGGEGLIRNILYGRAYHEGVLGDKHAGVYMPFDVFGHSMQLTQILAKTRYKGCVWRKGNPPTEKWVGVTVPGLPPDFMNVSPDGSTLHHRREHYKAISGTTSQEDLINDVMQKIRTQNMLGWRADFATLSSADFAYPEPWLAGHGAALKAHKPSILLSGPTAYFEAIRQQAESEGKHLPEVARDFSLYHAGTALSRANLKMANRYAENALLSAEKYATMAGLLGARYPEPALDKAWRQILFNQHHDGITGTCNDRSYFDMMGGFREALELAAGVRDNAASFLAAHVDTASAAPRGIDFVKPIVVFNPLGWTRTSPAFTPWIMETTGGYMLVDAQGREVPMDVNTVRTAGWDDLEMRHVFTAQDVPPMGYAVYYLYTRPGNAPAPKARPDQNNDDFTIHNEFYSLTVDPARGGTIVELMDKETGRKVISRDTKFPGNEIIVLQEDKGPTYPAWELSTTGVKARSSEHPAQVVPDHVETAEEILIVRGELPGLGRYEQKIILYRGVKRIDLVTTILDPAQGADKNDRNMWVVRFPAELNGAAPVVEDRFFAAARRRSLMPLSYRTDLEKMLTQSAPYSANHWVEEGVAVRLDILDRGGAPADAIALQLCDIVHTAAPESVAAAQKLQRALITRGVSCTPSLDTDNHNTDLLNRNFRFVIDIAGDNTYAYAALKGKRGETYKEWLSENGIAQILFEALANDMNISKITTLVLGAKDAPAMAEYMDDFTKTILADARIRINQYQDTRGKSEHFAPDDYGVALINRGTLLHSFDDNGTIVMGLFHSVQWAEDQMGTPFPFPELKTHRFAYSLYPHAGDWRAADTWKVAQEVNAPLTAVFTDLHPGSLSAQGSFVNIESDSIALSAMKAAGNPLAFMKTAEIAGPQHGVAVRIYETEGKPDTATLTFFRPIKAAYRANMLEEQIADMDISGGNTVTLDIGPNAVETIVVEFADAQPPAADAAVLGPDREPEKSIYTGYWDYNLGAAYMNNSPVTVTVDFPPQDLVDPELVKMGAARQKEQQIGKGGNTLRLTVSNNSADAPLSGKLAITVPRGWKAEPAALDVNLDPMHWQVVDLVVDAASPVESGWVRASLNSGGVEYFDVLRIRKAEDLDVAADMDRATGGDDLVVTIRNNQKDRITGLVMPVTPMEAWPESISGELALRELTPRVQPFDLVPDQTAKLTFKAHRTENESGKRDFWIMVKVLYNGEYLYLPVVVKD